MNCRHFLCAPNHRSACISSLAQPCQHAVRGCLAGDLKLLPALRRFASQTNTRSRLGKVSPHTARIEALSNADMSHVMRCESGAACIALAIYGVGPLCTGACLPSLTNSPHLTVHALSCRQHNSLVQRRCRATCSSSPAAAAHLRLAMRHRPSPMPAGIRPPTPGCLFARHPNPSTRYNGLFRSSAALL